MSNLLSVPLLLEVCPKSTKVADIVVSNFGKYCDKYEINTPLRVSAFIAQLALESDQFRATQEYASGSAYEGRTNLGNVFKGDGVKFKGRGYIQTTGRDNYKLVSKKIFGDDRLLTNPELLQTPENAMISAMIYWDSNGLNKYADNQYFQTLTQRINGGLNGFKERINYYNILCKHFGLSQYSYETRDIVSS